MSFKRHLISKIVQHQGNKGKGRDHRVSSIYIHIYIRTYVHAIQKKRIEDSHSEREISRKRAKKKEERKVEDEGNYIDRPYILSDL